ncbi:hypothetical protein D3C72_1478810 [compost metagenome]
MLEHTLAMLMMLPRPAASMPGSTAWMVHICARTLRRKAKSRSSSPACSMVPLCTTPAQLNSTSSVGSCATTAPMAALSSTSSFRAVTFATPA